MTVLPGWPGGGFDFGWAVAGPIFGGLIASDTAFSPRAGVLPSSDTLVSASTGFNLIVQPFVAVRVSGKAVLIGGQDTSAVVAIDAAPGSGSRIDIVYARPANVDASDSITAAAFISVGTASAAPLRPTLPSGAVELATVQVYAGNASAAAATITQTFNYTACTGGRVILRTAADLSSWSPANGAECLVLDGSVVYKRVGGAWVNQTPVPFPVAVTGTITAVNGSDVSSQRLVKHPSGLVSCEVSILKPAGWANGQRVAAIPVGFRPALTNSFGAISYGATPPRAVIIEMLDSGANLAVSRETALASGDVVSIKTDWMAA